MIPPMKASDLTNEVDLEAEDLGLGRFFNHPELYVMEEKFDGNRITVELREEGNIIRSKDRDVSDHFPHWRDACVTGWDGVVLDGEMLANGPEGVKLNASTPLLTAGTDKALARQKMFGPAWFVAFDIIAAQPGMPDPLRLSYDARRTALEKVVPMLEHVSLMALEGFCEELQHGPNKKTVQELWGEVPPTIQLVPSYPASVTLLDKFRDSEGFMIKTRRGTYVPAGRDGGGWFKFKWLATFDGFISSWTPGKNSLSSMVGSVELALTDYGRCLPDCPAACTVHIVEVASVGVFTMEQRRQLTAADGTLNPAYLGRVMECACQGMGVNRRARHPRFKEWRPDKDFRDCDLAQLDSIKKV